MYQKLVIFFTKEDGKNKYLTASNMSIIDLGEERVNNNPLFEAILGYKPHNLYALIDGVEFEIIKHPKDTIERVKKIESRYS
ncbi:hypothetical protein J2Z60_001824 [Lactobacillus colini]|uniref:Uncharacterized protein n=1 Tax=Lactobacillus colini TaxID=1819254 RepID=A0ABS4MH38_9LACO|nr:hypothetical protein [Lactobacillus colini]MBP2058636.1 hypothetical protein [Lactobacillus colini]